MKQAIALPLLSDILVGAPKPKYDRRLTDKILAAYAHAYEVGERSVAASLRRALEQVEGGADDRPRRRQGDALRQADLLVAFVDARNAYKSAAGRSPPDPEEVEHATRELLETYRRWSQS